MRTGCADFVPKEKPASEDASAGEIGALSGARSAQRFLLRHADRLDAVSGEGEQLVQLLAAERSRLGGGLHLDQATRGGHDVVHVHLGLRVLGVVEIE